MWHTMYRDKSNCTVTFTAWLLKTLRRISKTCNGADGTNRTVDFLCRDESMTLLSAWTVS